MSEIGWIDGVGLVTFTLAAILLFQPRISTSARWRATVTPLASIIGSGFLIIAPLLATTVGRLAEFAMAIIVVVSFGLGSAIRYIILKKPTTPDTQLPRIEHLSDIILSFAYVLSIAFYIRLLAAFVLDAVDANSETSADILACLVLAGIATVGKLRGLFGLEKLELVAVTLKLSIIAGLFWWLASADLRDGYDISDLIVNDQPLWLQLTTLAGMLLIVQGFETSKYLGDTYTPGLRASAMRNAQIISGLIYLIFIALVLPHVDALGDQPLDETTIIDISRNISVILPLLLIVAAVASQFSAAIADVIGAGGNIAQETRRSLSTNTAYALVCIVASAIVLLTDIFELVALASRAFACFYLLQTLFAISLVRKHEDGWKKWLYLFVFGSLALAMLFTVLFARPAD